MLEIYHIPGNRPLLDIAGGVLAIVSLYFGGHNCFLVEVVVFMTLILFYFLFMLLSSVTSWTAEGEPLAILLVFSSPICLCSTLTSFFMQHL